MLEFVNKGVHPAAAVSQLSQKYHVSESCLWSDWQRRRKWALQLKNAEHYDDFLKEQISKIDTVQKSAWAISYKAEGDSARVGALNTVLKGIELTCNLQVNSEILSRVKHVEDELAKMGKQEEKKGEDKQANS